jgi:hypothetical protein
LTVSGAQRPRPPVIALRLWLGVRAQQFDEACASQPGGVDVAMRRPIRGFAVMRISPEALDLRRQRT